MYATEYQIAPELSHDITLVRAFFIQDLIRSVDKDQTALSEGLSYEQFCQIASKKENDVYNEVDILNAFALFDSSARGYVTQEELTQLLCTRGDRLTPGEMAALIKTAEPTPEGHIDYETLVRSIMSQN